MDKKSIENILNEHLPEKALNAVVDLIIEHKVYLKITNSRSTKLGDFRVPGTGQQPRLSINYNLNPYSFLITLLHEIAHYLVWKEYQLVYRRIKPHGIEWKTKFQELMLPFLIPEVFPNSLLNVLLKHMQNPKASSSSDIQLVKELKKYDLNNKQQTVLADLEIGDLFIFRQAQFKIVKKNRTRYLCEEQQSKRRYLIHSLAEIDLVR